MDLVVRAGARVRGIAIINLFILQIITDESEKKNHQILHFFFGSFDVKQNR